MEELSALQIYWQLFKNIFVINSCTFGGGFVIIGMIKQKFTEQLHWISEEEVLDMTAIAQSAPGPLGINMAIITGYRIRKIQGALVCTLGAVLPPLIIISVISVFYNQFKDNAVIALALQVMRAGVAAFIAAVFFNVSAIVLILICAVVGLFDSIRCKRSDGSK